MTIKVTSTQWEDYSEAEKQKFIDDGNANKIKDDERKAKEENTKALKASAKAKLIAGEALTEDEANTIVI
tara:strand:+ start:582 stop:791 length:210 start_codon:yes stop_codon:yes gene_type:complete